LLGPKNQLLFSVISACANSFIDRIKERKYSKEKRIINKICLIILNNFKR
jgi:hypothetical protein